ncbi:phage holin family protein [Marilutibacter chinensis]|uniref:Phage holin family protein n=1 Tax=Marilutibacter chinensis TaxID=2912247 RepID=A0ABS9HR87_9GAMM|nr:phage holin family protein [Lysobacter chinensis]
MSDENTRSGGGDAGGPDPGGSQDRDDGQAAGRAGVEQALRDIGGAGRDSVGAAADAGRALRGLLLADLALARSALGHALIWMGVAVAFGGAACLLTMGALIALLQALGLSWLAALSITAVACIAVTALGGWLAVRYLRHTGLEATRRQLRRLGIGDDDDGDEAPHP